jgi:hypothetical protein
VYGFFFFAVSGSYVFSVEALLVTNGPPKHRMSHSSDNSKIAIRYNMPGVMFKVILDASMLVSEITLALTVECFMAERRLAY